MSLCCVFLGVCVFLFWVLFHFGSCVSILFSFLWCLLAFQAESRYYAFFWYKEAAISQPPEITLTTHSMHTPLASIFCVALIFLTNDESPPHQAPTDFRPQPRRSTWTRAT